MKYQVVAIKHDRRSGRTPAELMVGDPEESQMAAEKHATELRDTLRMIGHYKDVTVEVREVK